jgi:hypothetical protein
LRPAPSLAWFRATTQRMGYWRSKWTYSRTCRTRTTLTSTCSMRSPSTFSTTAGKSPRTWSASSMTSRTSSGSSCPCYCIARCVTAFWTSF